MTIYKIMDFGIYIGFEKFDFIYILYLVFEILII